MRDQCLRKNEVGDSRKRAASDHRAQSATASPFVLDVEVSCLTIKDRQRLAKYV